MQHLTEGKKKQIAAAQLDELRTVSWTCVMNRPARPESLAPAYQLHSAVNLRYSGTGTQSLFSSQSVTVYWFQHVPTCQNAIPGLSVAKDTFQRREANAYRIRLHLYLCLLAKQSYAKLICSFDIILIVSIPPKRVVCMCGY